MHTSARPPTAVQSPGNPPSPYQAAAGQLVAIHRQLRGALANVLQHSTAASPAPPAGLAEYTTLFSRFLLAHHHAEDTHLFPALRREGRLRSSDLDFLAGLDRDHREVHGACDRLIELCRSGAPDRTEVHRLATSLRELLHPHLAAEEVGLAADRLPHLVSAEALLAIQRQAQSGGGPQRAEILRLFDHPLHAQHAGDPLTPSPKP